MSTADSTVRPLSVSRALAFLASLLLPALLFSCAPTARVVGGEEFDEAPLTPYHGPRARIAVALFEDRTAKGYDHIGDGIATMFTTALVNSRRYIVLERDLIDEVISEQDLAAGGRVGIGTEAPIGEIEGAELLLAGAVTEFEPEKFGVGGALLGLGTLIGSAALHEKVDGLPVGAATYRESHIALDLRLIDTATSRILASVSVESRGQDWGGVVVAEVGGGYSRLPLAFGGFQKAATEKAVRKAVNLGVSALTLRAPPQYFRHGPEDFTEGRILGFSHLDLNVGSGASFPERGFRVAGTAEEWDAVAGDLDLSGEDAAPPVDFSARRVILIAAGTQEKPWRKIAIERIVTFPERVEITVSLSAPLPPGDGGKGGEEEFKKREKASLQPLILIHTEHSGLPVTVRWEAPQDASPPPGEERSPD